MGQQRSNMAKVTMITVSFLLVLAISAAAPAEKQPVEAKEDLIAPAEAKEDLIAEKDDLKTAASHYGGWGGYGGHWGGYGGHWGGYGGYPYWGSTYWGYPSWGSYGYGWPYGGWGIGHGGYWW